MTAGGTLGAFVSEVCERVASFDRPRLELAHDRGNDCACLVVTSATYAKVGTVMRLALAAGLVTQFPLLVVGHHVVITVPERTS